MRKASREARLNATFVIAADTLIADYDMVDLMHTLVRECTEILGATAGGLMLTDSDGRLQLIASTSESADLVEVMQLSAGAGPCIECFTTGTAVSVADIDASGVRWPAFRQAALEQGFLSAHATPMRLRGEVVGTVNLFSAKIGEMRRRDAAVAQALADVATIGILQERLNSHSQILAEQLQRALDSRIVIEQAKGVLAQATSLSMDDSFNAIRAYARNHNLPLRVVADKITSRTLDLRAGDAAPDATVAPRP